MLLEKEVVGELKLVVFICVTPEYEVVVAVARDEDSSGLLLVERSVSLGDDRLVGGERTS